MVGTDDTKDRKGYGRGGGVSKDWTGGTTLGTNIRTAETYDHDYYATDPIAIDKLLEVEKFNKNIWECAVGGGHLADRLKEHGYNVFSSDLVDRGYPNTQVASFFNFKKATNQDIITNPPYKYAKEFVEHGMEILDDGAKMAMFLKLTFLESKKRKDMFSKYPPKRIWVFSERVECAKNGEFIGNNAVAYCWYIWEKGFEGRPEIGWL